MNLPSFLSLKGGPMLKETYNAALAMRTAVYAMRAALRVESDRAVNPSL